MFRLCLLLSVLIAMSAYQGPISWHRVSRPHRLLSVRKANPIVGTLHADAEASFLALDERTHRLFILGGADGEIGVFDTRSSRLIRNVNIANRGPRSVVGMLSPVVDAQGGRVFVAVQGAGGPRESGVAVLDATTGKPVHAFIPLASPVSIALDAPAKRLFIGHGDSVRGTGSVSILDANTGRFLRRVNVGHYPGELVVDARTERVFAGVLTPTVRSVSFRGGIAPTRYYSGVVMLDARTGSVLHKVGAGAFMLTVDERRNRVFAFDAAQDGVAPAHSMDVIDAMTGLVRHIVHFGAAESAPAIDGVALDDRTDHLFAVTGGVDGSDGVVTMLDARSGVVLHAERVGPVPSAIVVDGRVGEVFIAYWDQVDNHDYQVDGTISPDGPGSVAVFDARSGRRARTITVGAGPTALTMDGRTQRLLVLDQGDEGAIPPALSEPGDVTIIDARRSR